MRMVVFVPSLRGAGRTRDSVAREVTEGGDEVAGFAGTPDDARWALDAWRADKIVGRADHLLLLCQAHPDLLDRVVAVDPKPRARGAAALLLVPAVWAWIRQHPRVATAVGLSVATVAAALVLATGGGEPMSPPRALPSRPAPTTATDAPPSSPPAASPSTRAPANVSGEEPVAMPMSRAPERVPRSPGPPPSRQPSPPSPSPSASLSETPALPTTAPPVIETPEQDCLIRVRLLGVDVRLCRSTIRRDRLLGV